MNKIIPYLWFDKNAEEAVKLYTSVIGNSSIGEISHYGKEGFEFHKMPEGSVMTVSFTLNGQSFMALNGGPVFTFNPSISFHIKCETVEEVDRVWNILIDGGTALMELGSYPFSKRYGWLQDKYGVSWQIIHTETPFTQRITPVMMFIGKNAGRAEEAATLYTSLFHNSKINMISRYGKGMEPDTENSINYASITLDNEEFGVMDSAHEHHFAFNEAISFLINCKDQQEVDYFWEKLTENGGEESMCGWLKDKFGVSWQVVPEQLGALMNDPDPTKSSRVTQAMFSMKKIIIADLERAYTNG
jgi:predicted 3-demethylubiquinone-9 3-methyltransferase (glyoxalase superfamily)